MSSAFSPLEDQHLFDDLILKVPIMLRKGNPIFLVSAFLTEALEAVLATLIAKLGADLTRALMLTGLKLNSC